MNVKRPTGLRVGLGVGIVALLSLLSTGPAQAADLLRNYTNAAAGSGYYLDQDRLGVDAPARLGSFGLTNTSPWYVQQISDSPVCGPGCGGNDRVFIKNAETGGRCLDDHAAANGEAAWVISCNGGDYQVWEVFYQGNGTRVFKSWGAWSQQRRHLCLSYQVQSNGTYRVVMRTCSSANANQQWYSHNYR